MSEQERPNKPEPPKIEESYTRVCSRYDMSPGVMTGQEQPYCCPVCQGRGLVSLGWYLGGSGLTNGVITEPCRSCDGSGVIWR